LTRFTTIDRPTRWIPPQREVIHILEGAVRIEIPDGPTLELVPGDIATLPAGLETTWHITTPFKELWVLGSEKRCGESWSGNSGRQPARDRCPSARGGSHDERPIQGVESVRDPLQACAEGGRV